jgi:type I restriction enzyme M protein
VLNKFPVLSLKEIKMLVVERKWMDALEAAVQGQVDGRSEALAGRIKQLAERYSVPMPAIAGRAEELSAQVDIHLKKMGFVWA